MRLKTFDLNGLLLEDIEITEENALQFADIFSNAMASELVGSVTIVK